MIGNGNGIPIIHVGSTTIEAPTTTFSLDNVLSAPLIKKNLLLFLNFAIKITHLLNFFLIFLL